MENVELYENWYYNTFEEFKSHHCDIWRVKFPKETDKWSSAICTCPAFDAVFICKHIIAIANSLGLLAGYGETEVDYDDEPLYETKRGRPKKTTKALIKE